MLAFSNTILLFKFYKAIKGSGIACIILGVTGTHLINHSQGGFLCLAFGFPF